VRSAIRFPQDIDAAVAALAAEPGSGLAVLPDGGFTQTHAATIHEALDRHPMPAIFRWRQFVSNGKLMSYGPDTIDIYRRSADYVDRIVRGAKPADLLVQQPLKFDLSINLKTAKELGIVIPQTLLVAADEAIE
jgi:putative ABC transport system substrate-binding protein